MCIACITVDTSWILPLLEFLINWLSSLSIVSRRQWLQLGFLLDSFTTSIAVTVNVFQGIPLSEILGVFLQILGSFPYDTSPVSMIKNAIMYLFSTLPHSMGALFFENIVGNAHWICGVWYCWSWIPTLEGFQGQNTSWATVVLTGWHDAPLCFCLYPSSYSHSHPLSCWKEVWVFGVSISLQMLLSSLVMLFLLYVHQSDRIYLVANSYLLSIYYAQHIKSAQLEYWIK